MESIDAHPISPDEARASLAEIDRIILHTRRTLGHGAPSAIIILWGCIWVVGFAAQQYFPAFSGRIWLILDLLGIPASFLVARTQNATVKRPHSGKVGLSWLILFAFAVIWMLALGPWDLLRRPDLAFYGNVMNRKFAVFWATVPMFAYILMGLWLDRFFIYLGALVTLATVGGYLFIHHYFFLWMAIVGGGSLIGGGIFIRKFWK
jgi:hypothetical protein